MTIHVPHQLSQAELVNRLENLLDSLTNRTQPSFSHLTYHWNPDRTVLEYAFQVSGFPVSGLIRTEPKQVIFEANLPPALRFFQQRIKSMLLEKSQKALAA